MLQAKFDMDTRFNIYSFLILNLYACGCRQHHYLFLHAYTLCYLITCAIIKPFNGLAQINAPR